MFYPPRTYAESLRRPPSAAASFSIFTARRKGSESGQPAADAQPATAEAARDVMCTSFRGRASVSRGGARAAGPGPVGPPQPGSVAQRPYPARSGPGPPTSCTALWALCNSSSSNKHLENTSTVLQLFSEFD